MTKDEALKLALVALDMMVTPRSFQAQVRIKEIYDSIREALAQPEQEPVACIGTNGELVWLNKPNVIYSKPVPLYTTPPKREWQGLTDVNEMVEAELTHYWNGEYADTTGARDQLSDFARAIEAKLKEKNT